LPLYKTLNGTCDETCDAGSTKRVTQFVNPLKKEKGIKERVCGGADEIHPAIMAFWEATNGTFWPQAGLIPTIIQRVGEDPARIELWKRINAARFMRGELLMDVDRSFAYLNAGLVPAPAQVRKPGPRPAGDPRARGDEDTRRSCHA